jgi:hypothetical protein
MAKILGDARIYLKSLRLAPQAGRIEMQILQPIVTYKI